MYEADANVSPFHPFRSRSPAPYNTHERGRDYSRERYEAEGNVTSRNRPSSPFHPSQSRSPPPHARLQTQRYNNGKDHFEGMYEADADITPRNSPPMSPVHQHTSYSPPPPFYSSSDDEDDNNSTYLFPEIATGRRSRGVSGSSTVRFFLSRVSIYQSVKKMLKFKLLWFVQPVHYKYQITSVETYEQERQFEPPELPDESQSFTMQEIARMRGLQSYGKEEIQLAISETYVSVANYKVRMSIAATLEAIIDKHGDIAASSKLQSTSTRSFYLESLAAAVMELKSTALRDLTKTRVAEIAAVVKDMDSVKIDVSWLKTAVTELAEAVEYYGKYDTAKIVREECDREMTAGKKEMEEMREELRRREKETKECRERVTELAGRLGQLEMKDVRVKKNLELYESKVLKFDGHSVLVD
ncbi:phospholipase-like protein (PEARLI 4) family protein [Arabidopsis thaliana]|nr:phospholipase-like protein (PEARLI 4) family protein [Arabidopsis thaliana]ANM62889.1 phospholipase-like protein (PEARLI 4) family protein [Arabidopsis thaliana]|eukprot:NP_001325015.1 phospholipase-like protein (PEARLI 4) family protein [Arabidopsis thaliana]